MSQAFTTNKPNQIKKYADNDETMMKIQKVFGEQLQDLQGLENLT